MFFRCGDISNSSNINPNDWSDHNLVLIRFHTPPPHAEWMPFLYGAVVMSWRSEFRGTTLSMIYDKHTTLILVILASKQHSSKLVCLVWETDRGRGRAVGERGRLVE